ncbi:MAG: hypothetical protein V7629_00905 [Motiliproteus sp.]
MATLIVLSFANPALAAPPQVQSPTPSRETLDRVQARAQANRAQLAKLKQQKRRIIKTSRISPEKLVRPLQPPKPRPQPRDDGYIYPDRSNERFSPFNLPGYVLPDPRKLRPLYR